MSKVIVQMSTKDWQDVSNHLAKWYGFKPSVRVLKRILKNERPLVMDIASHGNLRYGLDTSTREELVDVFARQLTRQSWPIGSTPKKESKRFFNAFQRAARKIKMPCDFDLAYLE